MTLSTARLLSLLAVSTLLAGCATAPPYAPDPSLASRVSTIQARNFLKAFRGGNFNQSGWENGTPVHDMHVEGKTLVLVRRSDNYRYEFPLADLDLRVDTRGGYGTVFIDGYGLWAIGNGGTTGLGGFAPGSDDLAYAKQLADAIYILKEDAARGDDPEEEAAFAKAAQAYRDAAVKPEIPEDVRRFKVQAEQAVKETRLSDASDFYRQGLAVSPWWADGRYNRALILAELKDYAGAKKEMGRFLTLAPDAPNAGAAKEKLASWQTADPAPRPQRER